MDALWNALLRLPQWIFAVSERDPTAPLVVAMDGKSWVFVFTDTTQLERFLRENNLRGQGELQYLTMPVDGARRWLAQAGTRGVFGVHFNFGGPGWFAPIPNIDAIHAHLMG
ncbi:MAG: hypothetical protein IT373_01915 [Polyangiaceae bacterium]|nr:hypothetical protein [Polyangiaceae bacterium]